MPTPTVIVRGSAVVPGEPDEVEIVPLARPWRAPDSENRRGPVVARCLLVARRYDDRRGAVEDDREDHSKLAGEVERQGRPHQSKAAGRSSSRGQEGRLEHPSQGTHRLRSLRPGLKPGRRRSPPLERGVRSFEDATLLLPTTVLLDTSFVVDALIPTQRHHESSRRFLEDLAVGGTTVVFSRLLEVELAEASFRIGLKELHRRDWARARLDGRSRRRGRARMLAVLAAWEATLEALNWARIEMHEAMTDVRDFMGRYGLSSYDAVHAASARYAGVQDLVTLDSGFAALPTSVVRLFVDSSRVRRCRQIRGGP